MEGTEVIVNLPIPVETDGRVIERGWIDGLVDHIRAEAFEMLPDVKKK